MIGTAVDGTVEIIRDNIDGRLVEPRNCIQMAKIMNWLIENPVVRRKLEAKAKERYQTEFSFDKLARRYIDFYEEL